MKFFTLLAALMALFAICNNFSMVSASRDSRPVQPRVQPPPPPPKQKPSIYDTPIRRPGGQKTMYA
uniref:Antibacterial peptide n=1 Tax=Musca domestica TaxID=7370 RepID=A0A088N522_MUSDO|nr:antibacterial peptide [Musca domestica]